MSRESQIEGKIGRAADELTEQCRQVERLSRRVAHVVRKSADQPALHAPLRGAAAELQDAAQKLLSLIPGVPEADSKTRGDRDQFIDALTQMGTQTGTQSRGETMEPLEIPPGVHEPRGECVLRGVSPNLPVPTALEFLALNAKTGVLLVETSTETFTIELTNGRIVHAVSDNTPMQERLGSVLLRREAVTEAQLEDVLERAEGASLGEILLQEKILSREDLLAALEYQAALLFRRLFVHTRTKFAFFEGDTSNQDIQIHANVTMLLLEGARENDETVQKESWLLNADQPS